MGGSSARGSGSILAGHTSSRKRSKWADTLPLLLACMIMAGLPSLSASVYEKQSSVVIHAAGETLDTSRVASLKPRSFFSLSWMVGILGAASGLTASHDTASKQWYVVLESGAQIQRLGQESGIAFGMPVAPDTYAATGSEEMARKLAGLDGVRWINERPHSHKVDKGLRAFTASSRRTGASSDMSKEEGAVQLKKLVVLLVPISQQHTPSKMTAKDFKELCDKEFAAKKWRAAVTRINDQKLLIELLEPERAVAGAVRTPSADVVEWLVEQWQVQWVEPKGIYQPMARYSSKLMTMGDFDDKYTTDAAKQTLTRALTSTAQTASWEVESIGARGESGRFCFWHNDQMMEGRNGTDDAFLTPVVAAMAMTAGTGYATNAGLMVTTIAINSSVPLASDADFYAGMQVQAGSQQRIVASYQRSGSSAFSGTITVHPAIPGPLAAGSSVMIWLVVQPGDSVTVMADATMWKGSLKQDWLPPEPGNNPNQRVRVQCPMEGAPPMKERIPAMLWDWGIRSLQHTCQQDVEQTARIRISARRSLTDETAPAECQERCQSDMARVLVERERTCVFNISSIVYANAYGQEESTRQWWCECDYRAPVPLVLTLKVPDANPLWEAGLSGAGQIVALADTGLDTGNCLLSEEGGGITPPQGTVDLERDNVVGVLRNTDCELCDGCSKTIGEDRWTFFGSDAELVPASEAGPGNPIWSFAWPHRCENAVTRSPTGCDFEADDAMLEPRRYSQLGARLEMGLSVSLPPPFETVPGKVKVYVLAREDYEKHRRNVTALDENRHLCLNQGCGEPEEFLEFSGDDTLKLRPSRRGYGVVIAAFGTNTAMLSNELRGGTLGLQFYSAEVPCGDYGDDARGHGTFCAGVIAGKVAGGASPAAGVGTRAERRAAMNHEGVAKDAQLLMMDLSSGIDGVDNLTVPLDLETGLLAKVHLAGARVLSNSWSCLFPQIQCDVNECRYTPEDFCNSYGTASYELDHFVWENPDLLVVVPAGDSTPPSGTAASGSLRSPATCKNCISVGSSHNFHAALTQSMVHVDAMDGVSAVVEGKRLMCPRSLFAPVERWPQNLGLPVPELQEGEEAPLLDGEIRGWPAEAAECCNTDPNHNTDKLTLIAQYQDLVDFNRAQGREATAQQYVLLQDVEAAKLYPCRPEPNCCLVPNSFCCPANYQGEAVEATPANALRPTKLDINRVVATSAKGPANDVTEATRVKPDMVAPGAFLVAANARGVSPPTGHCGLPGRRDEPFDENAALVAMSGTSVATAVIAGAAALVRQYFAQGWHPSGAAREEDKLEASAALVKACLLTSSQSVSRDGGSAGRTASMPNFVEGWGRPSLLRLLYLQNSGLEARRLWVVDETIGFENAGHVHEYEFLVDMSRERVELAITLTWTDPASSPGSDSVLVNDLDLAATDEGSVGWVNGRVCPIDPFTETFSEDCPKPIADTVNTVEKTDFWVQHKLICTYGKGSRTEYGGCFRELELGKLRGSVKDRTPSVVKVRVIAKRVTDYCASDGFYSTCSKRRQPYALVVSGPLLAREGDGSLLPPVFSSYPEGSAPPKDLDAAPIAAGQRRAAGADGGAASTADAGRLAAHGWIMAFAALLHASAGLWRREM